MYNLTSILKSVVNKLDAKRCSNLLALKQDASDMKSLHTSGAWKTEKAKGGKGGRMNTIPEEGRGSEPQDENGLGVFDDPNIHAALNNMNYKIAHIAYQVCVPSIT